MFLVVDVLFLLELRCCCFVAVAVASLAPVAMLPCCRPPLPLLPHLAPHLSCLVLVSSRLVLFFFPPPSRLVLSAWHSRALGSSDVAWFVVVPCDVVAW